MAIDHFGDIINTKLIILILNMDVKVRNYIGGEPGQFNFVFPIMRIIDIIKIIS